MTVAVASIRRLQNPLRGATVGHLRAVKDPFRAAMAARRLPPESRIRIVHLGAALSPRMAERARREESVNPRYCWLGEVPRGQALHILARSRVLALTSRLEGGANAISEAVVAGELSGPALMASERSRRGCRISAAWTA